MTSQALRILLLTSNTGYAHNAAANAIKEWLEYFCQNRVIVEIEYLLENSNWLYRQDVKLYNFIQRNIPRLHIIFYVILEYHQYFQDIRPYRLFIGKKYWTERLKEFRPDVIISTHCQINLKYFDLAKQILGNQVKFVTYCTEIDGGRGFTHNWINPIVNVFWSQTPEVTDQALQMKLDPKQIFTWGTLLNRSFYQPPLTETEKNFFLKQELNLEPERFTILLGTGGAGANNHLRFLRRLLPLQDQIQVIALCGKNVTIRSKLENWRSRHPDFSLCVLPFTDKMATLLQVSSVVVARPGARTSIESIHCGCPMIFNLLGGIMPQELLAIRYFKARNIEHSVRWPRQLLPIIQKWLEQPEAYQQLKHRITSTYQPSDPEQTINHLFKEITLP
ncbi:MAG: glycosyltransferase [Snowella sp.]|nr:glycosyltransferase [Snowella sp.]